MLQVYENVAGQHDLRIVALALFLCLLSAFTATALFDQASIARDHHPRWIALTGFVSGTGIWATHFVAMLAFEPHLPVGYDVTLTLSSILVAIVLSTLGWWIALGGGLRANLVGGAVIGAGIAAMHYLGMAAMIMPAHIMWDQGGILASIVVGVGLGALALAVHVRDSRALPWRSALLLTMAICGMHFTGMSAAAVRDDPMARMAHSTFDSGGLTVAVTAVALVILIIGFGVVLLDRRLARNAVEESRRLQRLTDAAMEGLVILDGERIVDANLSFWRLAGYYREENRPDELQRLFPDLDLQSLAQATDSAVEARLRCARVGHRDVELLMRRISWKGRELRALAVRDVTERKESLARISHLAFHDALTGLANRNVHSEHLATAVERAELDRETVAVLIIDLDGFKAVNELYGHPVGDELLVAVGRRLRALTRGRDDLVARLGGDEFSIIVSGGQQPAQASAVAERVLRALEKPFRVGATLVRIGASVGISSFPADAREAVDLIKYAEIALYRAKADGRGVVRCYDAAMDEEIRRRHQLGADLMGAIEREELDIHYQPIADAVTGEVVGFEALARWQHPREGAISPAQFIPLAEANGFMIKLGAWVLRRVIADAAAWPLALTLSVNVSPCQFIQGDLAGEIELLLTEFGLDPARLDIEVTESLLLRDAQAALANLDRLKALGVQITIDDFGTGYSSLSYFRTFPFGRVKIDQCFIHDLTESAQARAIVEAVIRLGHGLGMTVVAEGVETEPQLDLLRALGCDFVQGFLINRPKPLAQLGRLTLAAPLTQAA